ncbi:hypothetical protein ABVF11_03335 [Pediococcus argentinicus]|uniref:hypothetical protein n=1 Tax=Pediococcus argentinicus TaxID=480391 RepID=UPI00338E4AA5
MKKKEVKFMPFLALLVDAVTAAFYFLQLKVMSQPMFIIGLIVQIVAVLALLVLSFGYRGQRQSKWRPEGYGYMTIRYGIIIVSLVVNAIVLFLYILNQTGNNIIFSSF